MRGLKNHNGFSLIETVVGMVLLAILVGAVLSVTVGQDKGAFKDKVVSRGGCHAEANRLLNNFKNKSLIRNYYRFPPDPVGPGGALPAIGTNVPPPNEPASNETGVTFADRWNTAGAPDTINTPFSIGNPLSATNTTTLRPNTLIMGAISAIETIYNNIPATCSATGLSGTSATAPLTDLFTNSVGSEDSPVETTGLKEPESFLRIRLYNTNNGTTINACGGTHEHVVMPSSTSGMLDQIPRGLTGGTNFPPAATPIAGLRVGQTPAAGVRFNAGYEVMIRVEYENRSGAREDCEVAERFQYPTTSFDNANPLDVHDIEPVIDDTDTPGDINTYIQSGATLDYGGGGGILPARDCNDPIAIGSLNFRITNVRPGSVFMCRNLTRQRALNDTAGLNHFRIVPVDATTRRLRVLRPGGLRQTFYSSELPKNPTSFDNIGYVNRPDGTPDGQGFIQFNSLYYPAGNYFCSTVDNCPNLPRFDTSGLAYTATGHYDLYRPSRHSSNTNTGWNNTFKTGRWVPCEYAQISCATDDYASTETLYNPITEYVPGPATTASKISDGYHIRYTGLPTGCDVHMQVAEVDAAYNVRAIELYEYTHEAVPGNRLVHIAGRPADEWNFFCTSAVASPLAAIITPCPTPTARVATLPGSSAEFDLSSSCYIDYPGSTTNTDYRGGVWRADPAATEAYPP